MAGAPLHGGMADLEGPPVVAGDAFDHASCLNNVLDIADRDHGVLAWSCLLLIEPTLLRATDPEGEEHLVAVVLEHISLRGPLAVQSHHTFNQKPALDGVPAIKGAASSAARAGAAI